MKYEDFAGQIKCKNLLEQQLDGTNKGVELHLTKIAEKLRDLDKLVPALGLRDWKLRDIQESLSNQASQR